MLSMQSKNFLPSKNSEVLDWANHRIYFKLVGTVVALFLEVIDIWKQADPRTFA